MKLFVGQKDQQRLDEFHASSPAPDRLHFAFAQAHEVANNFSSIGFTIMK